MTSEECDWLTVEKCRYDSMISLQWRLPSAMKDYEDE